MASGSGGLLRFVQEARSDDPDKIPSEQNAP
jgi:hypothetical protein